MIQPSDIRLCIGTPCYGGLVSAPYLLSMIRTTLELSAAGIDHKVAIVAGDSLVTRARNGIVASFMADPKKLTHLLFIDADIGWEPAAVMRLLQHDQEVVVGVYPKKCTPTEWTYRPEVLADGTIAIHPVTGAVSLVDAPTGFMMMKRSAIERLMEAHPELKCHVSTKLGEDEKGYGYALFDTQIRDGQYLSEDYAFCSLWRDLGGKIWMDPVINLTHTGNFTFAAETASAFVFEEKPAEVAA